MASISRKKRSPYWMGKYKDESGRYRMRSTKETDAKKAKIVADTWERAGALARAGELTQAASIKILSELMHASVGVRLNIETVRGFLEKYVQARDGRTRERYAGIVRDFLAMLGARRCDASIGSLTAGEIERFRDLQITQGKSATTANFCVVVLRSALNQARRKGLALSNPAEAVEPLRSDTEKREVFTREDMTKLLAAVEDPAKVKLPESAKVWRGMILLGYHCGIRLRDAANLTWSAFDERAGTLAFRQQKTGEGVVIVLHSDVMEWLEEQQRGASDDRLFPDLAGRETKGSYGLSAEFSAIIKAAGIEVKRGREKKLPGVTSKGRQFTSKTFHSLRHTFVSALANNDISADVRKAISGHASDAAHDRYTHLALDTQRRAMAKMPSVL